MRRVSRLDPHLHEMSDIAEGDELPKTGPPMEGKPARSRPKIASGWPGAFRWTSTSERLAARSFQDFRGRATG